MEALGRLFDIVPGITPVDFNTAGGTGKVVHLKNAASITFVVFAGVGSDNEGFTATVREHTALSGGTSQDLDTVVRYYTKNELTLDGDETWTKVTQTAGDVVQADSDNTAQLENLYVFSVDGTELSDGFEFISLDIADDLGAAKIGCVLYVLHDLNVQRAPANLANPQL